MMMREIMPGTLECLQEMRVKTGANGEELKKVRVKRKSPC
jgi:hypothetical protein